jgi:hypothetical protein
VARFIHSGSKIGFSWTNGDADAQVQTSYDEGSTVEKTLAPKTNSDSNIDGMTEAEWNASGNTFAVRHIDGIYTSAGVEEAQ